MAVAAPTLSSTSLRLASWLSLRLSFHVARHVNRPARPLDVAYINLYVDANSAVFISHAYHHRSYGLRGGL